MRDVVLKLAPLALAALVAVPAAADDGPFEWKGRLTAGKTIEVKGVNGGVDAAAAGGADVEVVAAKRARRSDPASVRIEVVDHAGGVTICAVYPDTGSGRNECAPGSKGRMNVRDNDVSVDFTVKVPSGVRFVGRTVNGGVEATGLGGDAEAYTVNGAVRLSTTGTAQAETVNGGITATLGRLDGRDPLEFRTVNGSIRLHLPANAAAEVRAETVNGGISTDFPLTVQGRVSRRKLSGTIGAGGKTLALETVNGSIQLRRTP